MIQPKAGGVVPLVATALCPGWLSWAAIALFQAIIMVLCNNISNPGHVDRTEAASSKQTILQKPWVRLC